MPRGRGGRNRNLGNLSIDWRGDQVLQDVLEAAKKGIDQTMVEAAKDAQEHTPVVTGTLQGSIQPFDENNQTAQIKGNRVEGKWGSHDVEYAIYVETGTHGRQGRHMLTNAADKEYPHLKERIRDNLRQ